MDVGSCVYVYVVCFNAPMTTRYRVTVTRDHKTEYFSQAPSHNRSAVTARRKFDSMEQRSLRLSQGIGYLILHVDLVSNCHAFIGVLLCIVANLDSVARREQTSAMKC